MPFTLSHAVLAPPLSKLSRGYLPVAALAIGCMTPDLYRLFTEETIELTHQWSGILFPNLPIGLLFWLLWYFIYRPISYRFLGLKDPLHIKSFDDVVAFSLMSCLAIMLGTATHLIWDGLTHLDFRTFAFKDFLAQDIALLGFHYPLHFILQIMSSIVTLPFLWLMCRSYYRTYRHPSSVSKTMQIIAVMSCVISVVAGVIAVWHYSHSISAELWHSERYFFIGKSINGFMQTGLCVFTASCLLLLLFNWKTFHP